MAIVTCLFSIPRINCSLFFFKCTQSTHGIRFIDRIEFDVSAFDTNIYGAIKIPRSETGFGFPSTNSRG